MQPSSSESPFSQDQDSPAPEAGLVVVDGVRSGERFDIEQHATIGNIQNRLKYRLNAR